MADPRNRRHPGRITDALSQRTYTLQPARPLAVRVVIWSAACVFSATLGAASLVLWQTQQRAGSEPSGCATQPISENQRQTELMRARLALAEESAARAAVQKTADSAAAEVARLTADVQFLRGQSRARRTVSGS